MTAADAARKYKTSQTSVAKWRDQFLESGKAGLAAAGSRRVSGREERLEAVRIAIAEAERLGGAPLAELLPADPETVQDPQDQARSA